MNKLESKYKELTSIFLESCSIDEISLWKGLGFVSDVQIRSPNCLTK